MANIARFMYLWKDSRAEKNSESYSSKHHDKGLYLKVGLNNSINQCLYDLNIANYQWMNICGGFQSNYTIPFKINVSEK